MTTPALRSLGARRRASRLALAAAALAVALAAPACGDKDDVDSAATTFACGDQGGSCELGQVCLLNDGCSSCIDPAPECDDGASCDCQLASDRGTWGLECSDPDATCEETVEGGLVVTCSSEEWGCG